MASTAHKSKQAKREYFDPPDVLQAKVDQLATLLRESHHAIAFSGAGISTAAGIPDFRSGVGTVLETGPGVWELRAAKQVRASHYKTRSTLQAIPTPTHMLFVELQRKGILKHLISQNTDGLHRRSGFPAEALSELHGNSNLEICKKCGKQYLRDYRTRTNRKVHRHATGRFCSARACGGKLYDTIVNFGESLPAKAFGDASYHSERADLCIAMGSSLTVTPAADLPEEVADRDGANLVIINLQKTPLHHKAALVIHAKCDDVSRMLADALGLHIPRFQLRRWWSLEALSATGSQAPSAGKAAVHIKSHDADGTPFSVFQRVVVRSRGGKELLDSSREPFVVTVPPRVRELHVLIQFAGHYNEPPLKVSVAVDAITDGRAQNLCIEMDPVEDRQWQLRAADPAAAAAAAGPPVVSCLPEAGSRRGPRAHSRHRQAQSSTGPTSARMSGKRPQVAATAAATDGGAGEQRHSAGPALPADAAMIDDGIRTLEHAAAQLSLARPS